jgi:hypothetical protein
MLRFLRNETDLPWLCVGNFNEIIYAHEQFGGNDRGEWMMEGFRDVISYVGFTDLGFSGLPYLGQSSGWLPQYQGPPGSCFG